MTPPFNKSKMPIAILQSFNGFSVDYRKWLQNHSDHNFNAWLTRMTLVVSPKVQLSTNDINKYKEICPVMEASSPKMQVQFRRDHVRQKYIAERYTKRWRQIVRSRGKPAQSIKLVSNWLQAYLFNKNSRVVRRLVTSLLPTIIHKDVDRQRELLNLLNTFLPQIGENGEAAEEFVQLYRSLAQTTPWSYYLVLRRHVMTLLCDLLKIEIEKIHCLEMTTLSSDLAQGYALIKIIELLAMFLESVKIRQVVKGRILGPVLEGYLHLRRLVVQRTRMIDDAQEKLLELLEEMTTGTEAEIRAFMVLLIDTVSRTPVNDIKTPVFVFERLCTIIVPEENDVGEFFLILEKDQQQEDFLQGRMLGNPYPSAEPGLGPLMRNVKNKICTDCELVALLEDDNGMELLVFNKIISLDLCVKDVYKKIWLLNGGDRDTMRIVYRMRGLLGDATEEFIERLDDNSADHIDIEQVFRMANVLADDSNGLQIMLERIASIQNVVTSRQLLQVLLKLFLIAVKVRRCQEVLCLPALGAINIFLKVLQLCLLQVNDAQQSSVTEQLLEIMETILSKSANESLDSFLQFSLTFGGSEYVTALISCTQYTNVRNNPSVLRHLIRVLAALVYGNDLKMALLCEHFRLNFEQFDYEHNSEDEFRMELFCVLTNQIEHNAIGSTLKDYIMGLGIVERSLTYITSHAPCVKPTLLRVDSDELKDFILLPSLKYILRFLTGLAIKHAPTQLAISKDIIPIIHRLEQVSSDEHVGSLAENLLEALCTDPQTSKRVQEVRDFTRTEKKRLAMATRVKQLDALGMRTNEKGQVTAKGSILQNIDKLREETGFTCFICREGYTCQPNKVLGIYTFTKRCSLEEFELKTRKTQGYTTVTHFNIVHTDCHTAAIRLARGRDEWESASLQNANTRCNGLLPMWGPEVPESAFVLAISRHTANLQESTQRLDITSVGTIHDLKLLLLRFASEKSFHDDAGGGGPQSNMHLVPYLLFFGLYGVISQSFSREEKSLTQFCQQQPTERWIDSAYEVDGPFFQATLSLALHTPNLWRLHRLQHLRRLFAAAYVRHISPGASCKQLPKPIIPEYSVYKVSLMMWALVDMLYINQFSKVTVTRDEDWPVALFNYIRRNDEAILKTSDAILIQFSNEFLPCTSFAEFCDVAGMYKNSKTN